MNRFDEDFDRDMTVIAERVTPSPDAWAEIQQRIADREPHQETEIIMLTDNTLTRRRWPLVAAAAAVVALAITGIALVNRGDAVEVPADTVPTVIPDAVDPEVVEPEPEVAEPSAPPASELPSVDQPVAAGTYFTDELGVPLTFDVADGAGDQFTREVTPTGAIQLGIRSKTLEIISIGRIGSFYGGSESSDGTTLGLGNIAADDIDGWIETNDITLDHESDGMVGDRPAKLRRVRFDNKHPNGFWSFSGSADVAPIKPQGFFGDNDTMYAVWLVDMDDFEPILIWTMSNVPDQQQWIDDIAMPLINSIEFGAPAPAIPGGTARVPLREQFFASYTTTRGAGTVLADGTIERIGTSTITGDLTGETTGTGIEITPANGYDDIVFTGTIDGIGTGTLTMYQEWTGSANGDIALTTFVTDGTDDFVGVTGRVFTSVDAPDESGPEPVYSGRMTFDLAIPRSG